MSEMILDPAVKWIWNLRKEGSPDTYMAFRKCFDLDEVPGSAGLQIAADSTYTLFVNGIRVPGGQFSDYPSDRSYSTFDVAKLLKKGRNVIAVSVHFLGEKFHVYMPGTASLRLALFSGRELICGTDGAWKCAPEPGFLSGSARKMTFQAGFIFEYDARKEVRWQEAGFDDSSWENAGVYAGNEIDLSLSPRPVPQVVEKSETPGNLISCAYIVRRERPDAPPPAELCFTDLIRPAFRDAALEIDHIVTDPVRSKKPLVFGGDHAEFIKAKALPGDGTNGLMLQLDLGKEECGFLHLRLSAGAGTTLDIAHGEHLQHGRVLSAYGRYNFADRYVCKEGINDFIFTHRRIGCRYLELHVTDIKGTFALHTASLIPLELPLPPAAEFDCEERVMLHLRELSLRTMTLCMHEHYEDCPWREQALWNFDARIQMFLGYYVWGNYDFAAASLDLMRKSCKEGFLSLTEPGDGTLRTIPMFSLAYIVALRERLLFGGFWEGLAAHLPTVDEILGNALQYKKDGLYYLPEDPRFWLFYEWVGQISDMRKWPQSLWNIYLFEALRAAAFLHRCAGSAERADAFEHVALALGAAVEERFREPECYGVQEPGKNRYCYALTQCLMIALKLAPPERLPLLWKSLNSGKLIDVTTQNQLFEMEALMNCTPESRAAYAERIYAKYRPMLDYGATSLWETGNGPFDMGGGASLCHAWSAIPAAYAGRYLLGVRPEEPGFAAFSVRIAPGSLTHAEGTVPTPHGRIRVAWRKLETGGLAVQVGAPPQCRIIPEEFPEFPVESWQEIR
ncbi:MAG: family 78 glycoside hydrolase catalytic domain [Lentisphaeria bacterium]|nr:family 78 glycoside hydrolase catalytic domain [Lentisphaeria bacterium]